MDRFGLDETVPLEAGLVTRSIESAQKRVEGFNFDRRKQVVEMDDVINVHREVIYSLRRRILEFELGKYDYEDWFIEKLSSASELTKELWKQKQHEFTRKIWFEIVCDWSLSIIDSFWMDHLVDMDQVREGIGLRGYAQRDPMIEYKKEGHDRFEILLERIYSSISDRLLKANSSNVTRSGESVESFLSRADYKHGEIEGGVSDEMLSMKKEKVIDSMGREVKVEQITSGKDKIGRNDPCPCGSGKKYKHCHGK
jgi:preprotein translocase subunit SecA